MANPVLEKFATMTVTLGDQFMVRGGPVGSRITAEVATVEVTGETLNASLQGIGVGQNTPEKLVYELYEVKS